MEKIILLEGNWPQRHNDFSNIKKELGDCETFYFDETFKYDYVSQSFTEFSCFGLPRMFVITGIPYMKTAKMSADEKEKNRTKVINELKKDILLIPDGNTVILMDLKIRSKPLIKLIDEYGKTYQRENQVNSNQAKKWIKNHFKAQKKEIDNKALNLVIDYLSSNYDSIEIDKLYLLIKKIDSYTGIKKNIGYEDVYDCCSQSKEFIIWNLYNAFDGKDVKASLSLIYDYLSSSKNVHGEIIKLIGQFRWKYSLLLLIKSCLEQKMSKQQIIKTLGFIEKFKRVGKAHLIKMIEEQKPKYTDKAIEAVFYLKDNVSSIGAYSIGELYLINATIDKATIRDRTGSTQEESFSSLLFIVAVICGKIKKYNYLKSLHDRKNCWKYNEIF